MVGRGEGERGGKKKNKKTEGARVKKKKGKATDFCTHRTAAVDARFKRVQPDFGTGQAVAQVCHDYCFLYSWEKGKQNKKDKQWKHSEERARAIVLDTLASLRAS